MQADKSMRFSAGPHAIWSKTTRGIGPARMVLAAMLCMVWPMNALAQEQSDAAFEAQLVAKGQALVEEHCAQCHAIGRRDTSSHAEAPPFREVVQRYPPEQLAEAFAEGIQTGHPDMPIFIFEPEQIGTLIVYLNTLIEPEPGSATE